MTNGDLSASVIAKLTEDNRLLRSQLATMQRRHLQFVCLIVHSIGGEMRLTKADFMAVPPNTELYQMIDPATGDMCYTLVPPQEAA